MKTLLVMGTLLAAMGLAALTASPTSAQQKNDPPAGFEEFFQVKAGAQASPKGKAAPAATATPIRPRPTEEQQRQMEAIEAQQSPTILRDKYMISLSRLLKEQKFSEALPYFDKLDALQVAKDPLLDYYHGEALYKTGRPEQALQLFYRYIETQGDKAPLYQKSLEMVIKIEGSL